MTFFSREINGLDNIGSNMSGARGKKGILRLRDMRFFVEIIAHILT
jgi:hypothetical protein